MVKQQNQPLPEEMAFVETRSLTVAQRVHLKTFKSLGHRMVPPQAMQFPAVMSLGPSTGALLGGSTLCFRIVELASWLRSWVDGRFNDGFLLGWWL